MSGQRKSEVGVRALRAAATRCLGSVSCEGTLLDRVLIVSGPSLADARGCINNDGPKPAILYMPVVGMALTRQ